ncbi:MAG: hypothetical protein IPN26_02170 [Bacteroidetes bacterium]|nr:hypothetical protein [Bacteroidota bacterium]
MLQKFFFLSLLLLLEGITQKVIGQINSWNHTHYTTKDGLPSTVVHNITQDRQGFIWIATESGLCRFDGDEFVKVLHDQNDSTSIPSDYVYCITVAPDGKLLCSTSNGLYVMNTTTRKGYTIHSRITKGWESMDYNFKNIYVNTSLERIFVLTATAILIFDYNMVKLNTIAYQFPSAYENIGLSITNYSPLFLSHGDIIFADNFTHEWGLFDYKKKSIVPFKTANTHPYAAMFQKTAMDCFTLDSLGYIWFHEVGKDTLYCAKPNEKLIAYPMVGEARKTGWTGRICFPTSTTMTWAYINEASTVLYELPYEYLLKNKGSTIYAKEGSGFSATINSHFTDKTGNWWIGSINGLYLVKSNRKDLEQIELPVPFKFESDWQYVTGIKPVDEENILITTQLEHCFLYNTKQNTVRTYLDSVGYQNAGDYAMHFIIPLDKQRHLIYGNQGFMFQDHQLFKNPKLTNPFEKLFDQYAVKRFFIDSKENRWVSFEEYGLVFWNSSTATMKLFKPKGEFCSDKFTSITEDVEGNLWCLNYVQAKLWKLDIKTLEFDSTSIDLPSKFNSKLIAGANHFLYMVSSHGLLIFDTKTQRSKIISMYEKLPSNNILGLYYYNQHLFISTKNGLAIMNTVDNSIRTISHQDGIVEGIVTRAYYEDKNSLFYIGGKGHVYKINLCRF